ncbi:hypothetical protein [Lelliottia amnigena]
MKLCKVNNLLIFTVLILLWLTIMILIKVLLSGNKGFEWGNVSDWVSSLSSIGTLYIAYQAYRKAPIWLNQRKHESAFDIAKTLIIDNIPDLEHNLATAAANTRELEWKFDILSSEPAYFLSLDECINNLSAFDNSKINPNIIKKQLQRLNRLGWVLTEESSENLDDIFSKYESFYRYHYRVWADIKRHIEKENSSASESFVQSCLKRIQLANKGKENFDATYEKFNSKHQDFDRYFNRKTDSSNG